MTLFIVGLITFAFGAMVGWQIRAIRCEAKHDDPLPGICGDRGERIFVYDGSQFEPVPLCELRAGHAGWHETADGVTKWTPQRLGEEPTND